MSRSPTALRDLKLDNGIRIVVEPMPHLPTLSATLSWSMGTVLDPDDAEGVSPVLHEWLQRGAAGRDARAQADAFDRYGAHRGGGVGRESASLAVSCLARDAGEVLPLLLSAVLEPLLDESEFEGARQLALQELAGLDDAPVDRLAEAALRARYASVHGRSAFGRREHLEGLRPDRVRRHAGAMCVPDGTVLAVAGGGDPDAWIAQAARLLGGWRGVAVRAPAPVVRAAHRHHVDAEGAQTQIALLDTAVAPDDPGWTEQALAMGVLAGGMGSRLSSEVRERRGLAYAVGSSVRLVAGDACRFSYAGTTPERAGETVEVLAHEIDRLRGGVEHDELRRARALLRAGWVLESESSGGRADRLATDVRRFGYPRTTEAVLDTLDRVDLDAVNAFLAARPSPEFTVVTGGPAPLGLDAVA